VPCPEHVAYEAIGATLVKAFVAPGNDSCRVLPSMLQYGQRVIYRLICGAVTDYSYYATHGSLHFVAGTSAAPSSGKSIGMESAGSSGTIKS
jgi:hypothetical protein